MQDKGPPKPPDGASFPIKFVSVKPPPMVHRNELAVAIDCLASQKGKNLEEIEAIRQKIKTALKDEAPLMGLPKKQMKLIHSALCITIAAAGQFHPESITNAMGPVYNPN